MDREDRPKLRIVRADEGQVAQPTSPGSSTAPEAPRGTLETAILGQSIEVQVCIPQVLIEGIEMQPDDPAGKIFKPQGVDPRGAAIETLKGNLVRFLVNVRHDGVRLLIAEINQIAQNGYYKLEEIIEFDDIKDPQETPDGKFILPLWWSYAQIAAYLLKKDIKQKLLRSLTYLFKGPSGFNGQL